MLPSMRVLLQGISGFSHWLSVPAAPLADNAVPCRIVDGCEATQPVAKHLAAFFPHIPQPYQVLVPQGSRSSIDQIVSHGSTYRYRGKPFVRIGHGVFAPVPELCFVQLARQLSFHELIHAGNALCGTFYVDPAAPGGLGSRAPLTTVKRIEMFVRHNPGMHGIQKARTALKWVVDGIASPPESFLWMVLGLEHRHGGYHLPGLVVNRRIVPSKKAQQIAGRSTLVPDLCCLEARLAIEYDSNAEHLTPQQVKRDATKRLALEVDGFKVIAVTALQLGNCGEMRTVAEQACHRMGKRFRLQSDRFGEEQHRLFRMKWGFDQYHAKEWLSLEAPRPAGALSWDRVRRGGGDAPHGAGWAGARLVAKAHSPIPEQQGAL